MQLSQVMHRLKEVSRPDEIERMAAYGLAADRNMGVRIPDLRRLAREIGMGHNLALELWAAGYRETRILAGLVADPDRVDPALMNDWAADLSDWEVCDQNCINLFRKTPWAWEKAVEWVFREEEFVRRAGYVLVAALAVHEKEAPDQQFIDLLPLVEANADDDRNFVKKAANWALRQIGKKNAELNRAAVELAARLKDHPTRSGRWIGSDAHRELTSDQVRQRLGLTD